MRKIDHYESDDGLRVKVDMPADDWEGMLEAEKVMNALQQAGVDNWSGYDYAMELLDTPD